MIFLGGKKNTHSFLEEFLSLIIKAKNKNKINNTFTG